MSQSFSVSQFLSISESQSLRSLKMSQKVICKYILIIKNVCLSVCLSPPITPELVGRF